MSEFSYRIRGGFRDARVDIRPLPVTMSRPEPERSLEWCLPVGRHVDRPPRAYGDSR